MFQLVINRPARFICRSWKFISCFGAVIPILLSLDCQCLHARQSTGGQALEYIESSSPLPGGGVVSSVYYPGRQPPTETTFPSNEQGRSVLVRDSDGDGNQPRIAQNPTGYVYPPANFANPSAGFNVAPTTQWASQNGNLIPVAHQVPSLGVPVPWNRALRPDCVGCGTGNSYTASPVYGPASLAGLQPPAATLPPALPSTGSMPAYQALPQAAAPAPRPTYQPLVQFQNMQPNAYPGQGIIGSPKLYVDGQPVRNLLRYLIIP